MYPINNLKYRTEYVDDSKNPTLVTKTLEQIFVKYGNQIIEHTQVLFAVIDGTQLSDSNKLRLKLVFSCSTVKNYLCEPKLDIKMPEINNMIHVVCSETGLSYAKTVEVLSDIFQALGVKFSIVLSKEFENEGETSNKISAIIPNDIVAREVEYLNKSFLAMRRSKGKDTGNQRILETVKNLCKAGIADGYYFLSLCYFFGFCNTNKDNDKGMEYIRFAANSGSSLAAAEYADCLYETDDIFDRTFNKAFYYYTKPGSVSLKAKQRMRVKDILRQKYENRMTVVFSFILSILAAAFLLIFNKGLFSETNRFVVGIIFTILIFLVSFVVCYIYFARNKYDSLRWALTFQFVLWAIYVFILELA